MLRGVRIAGQGANAGDAAGLEADAVAAFEQGGVGFEEAQHMGEAPGRKAVAGAKARSLLEPDRLREAVFGEEPVCNLERLFEADRPAQAMATDFQEDLVGDVVV